MKITQKSKYIQVLIPLFAFAIIIFLSAINMAAKISDENHKSKIIVYYFYNGEFRCESCIKMEKIAYKAIKQAFKKELDNNIIVWRPLDKEAPENALSRNDFNITYNTLIISEEKDGVVKRWKEPEKAWNLISKDRELIKYIQDEIRLYLKGE